VCLRQPRISREQSWQLGILAALLKTIRVRARHIQGHKRGNKASVGIASSQFVGNIKLSLEIFHHSRREFRENRI
jgi:hypothetical protein